MFIRDDLVEALRAVRPVGVVENARTFGQGIPSMLEYKDDLKAAGILFKDSQGRQADFHALRHTLATNLARAGIQPRVAMELMRHSDMRLTNKTYTDAALLPMAEALERLPRYDVVPSELQATGTDGEHGLNESVKIAAHFAAQSGVCTGLGVSSVGTESVSGESAESLDNKGESHQMARGVTINRNTSSSSAGRTRTYNQPVNSRLLYH